MDNKVPKKDTRPYYGTTTNKKGMLFFQPLATVKTKHFKMQSNKDFRKLILANGEFVGVININNLIPIPDITYATLINFKTIKESKYKYIMIKQFNALKFGFDEHNKAINKFVDKYYTNNLNINVLSRTIDFNEVEKYYKNKKLLKTKVRSR
ncbi:MAG: type III toxin-antitoxin system ToxN/AbiQ family toxin [Anaerorhabdus sp.]